MISYVESTRPNLDSVSIIIGQMIYCSDTLETFYDTSQSLRIQLSNVIRLATEADRMALTNIETNKIYFVVDTSKVYTYDMVDLWYNVTDHTILESFIDKNKVLIPGTFMYQGKAWSLRTLSSTIYDKLGNPLEEKLENVITKDPTAPSIPAGNIPIVDENGNIVDSGKNVTNVGGSGKVRAWYTTTKNNNPRHTLAAVSDDAYALAIGGVGYSGPTPAVERFNHSTNTWAAHGNIVTARNSIAAAGITTDALIFGGTVNTSPTPAVTERYNGTTWSNVASNTVSKRTYMAGCGLANSALVICGANPTGSSLYTQSEIFNGTTWANKGWTTYARMRLAGFGTTSNALCAGGIDNTIGTIFNNVEAFNGTSWSNKAGLIISRNGLAGTGNSTDGICFGGEMRSYTFPITEHYTSTNNTWSVDSNMNTARVNLAGAANASNTLSIGGNAVTSSPLQVVEKYLEVESNKYNTIIDSANSSLKDAALSANQGKILADRLDKIATTSYWATAPYNILTARSEAGGCGSVNDAALFGGRVNNGNRINTTEIFNSTAWTAASSQMSIGRGALGSSGIRNDALAFGGEDSQGTVLNTTERFNNNTWSSLSANLVAARKYTAGYGIFSNTYAFGGKDQTTTLETFEQFNGTVWATKTGTIAQYEGYTASSTGITNVIRLAGGLSKDNLQSPNTFIYNGTSWSTGADLITARGHAGSTQDLVYGGVSGTVISSTEAYTGIAWSARANMTTNRAYMCRVGTTGAYVYGGSNDIVYSGATNLTESYYVQDLSNGVKIIDSLSSTDPNAALSARQGKMLNDKISNFSINPPSGMPSIPPGSILVTDEEGKIIVGDMTTDNILSSETAVTISREDMLTAREALAGSGIATDALSIGGNSSSGDTLKTVESFNNYTWSVKPDMNTGRSYHAATGVADATLVLGNMPASGTSEFFNGTAWAVGGLSTTSRYGLAMIGVYNDALAFGGYNNTTYIPTTESYNGTAWSAGGDLNSARGYLAGAGTSTTALAFGGYDGTSTLDTTESYDGTTWSVKEAVMNSGRSYLTGSGATSDKAIAICGLDSEDVATPTIECLENDIWSIKANATVARSSHGSAGGCNNTLIFGGNTDSGITSVVEQYINQDHSEGIIIADDCNTEDDCAVLSAAQGKELSNRIDALAQDIPNAANDTPKAPGTASVGLSTEYAREDHVHPLQANVSGNAGTATKLQIPRKINGTSFDGTKDIRVGPLTVTGITITPSDWAVDDVTGYYKYTYSNINITASTVVNVNFTIATTIYAEMFGVLGGTESTDGAVSIYAEYEPTLDLIADVVML